MYINCFRDKQINIEIESFMQCLLFLFFSFNLYMQDKNIEQDSKFSFKKLWEYMGPGWLMYQSHLEI